MTKRTTMHPKHNRTFDGRNYTLEATFWDTDTAKAKREAQSVARVLRTQGIRVRVVKSASTRPGAGYSVYVQRRKRLTPVRR